ncbi:MAG: hypothetical protein JW882_16105 [Deltaproteobacteria bacterium]|nr:hypothetical protein [Deltaproteobacteria bacterium]
MRNRAFVILLVAVILIFCLPACGKKAPPHLSGHKVYPVSAEQGTDLQQISV